MQHDYPTGARVHHRMFGVCAAGLSGGPRGELLQWRPNHPHLDTRVHRPHAASQPAQTWYVPTGWVSQVPNPRHQEPVQRCWVISSHFADTVNTSIRGILVSHQPACSVPRGHAHTCWCGACCADKEADKPLDKPIQPLPLKPWSVQANVNRSGAIEFAANGPQSSANAKPPTSSPPEASVPSSGPDPHLSSASTSPEPPSLPSEPSSSASPAPPPAKPFATDQAHAPEVESEPDDSERTTDSERDVPHSLTKPRKPFTVSRIDTTPKAINPTARVPPSGSTSGESEQRFTSHQRAASRSQLMLAELADSEATTPGGPALRSREQPRSSARQRKELQVLSLTVPIIPFNALILDPQVRPCASTSEPLSSRPELSMGGIHHHRSRLQALFLSSRKIVYNGKWGARSVAVLIMAQVLCIAAVPA